MVMDTVQIRLGDKLIKDIDKLVKNGLYSNRSDAIREAVRHFFWYSQIGSIKHKGNAVELVRKARDKLSKKDIDLNEINNL